MWRPRLPRDPDTWPVLAMMVGIPVFFLITSGAPVLPTLLIGAVFGGLLLVLRG